MQCNPDSATALTGVVFDIQRCSVHDGHGIRTVVFLKGCPLTCAWCTNPESQKPKPQIGFFAEKCAGCMRCAEVCPNGEAFRETGQVDWARCQGCMKCVDACLYEARAAYGKRMTVDQVLDAVRRDKVFFDKSGGGVTLTGGEVAAQPAFARELLRRCQAEGIHTAIETSGYAPWASFEGIVRHVDLLLYDFKNMDTAAHQAKIGVGNERILDNAVRASSIVREMVARFPLIPDYNDSEENAHQIGAFIQGNMPAVKRLDILKYHSVGESKSARIGKAYEFRYEHALSDEKVDRLRAILESYGLAVSIGG